MNRQPLRVALFSTSSVSSTATNNGVILMRSPLFNSGMLPKTTASTSLQQVQQQQRQLLARHAPSNLAIRALSSKKEETSNKKEGGDDAADTKEIVMTPGETVVAASRLTMWAGVAVVCAGAAYFIAKELFPTKMSPNRVFDRSFDIVRKDPEVQQRYGDSLKAYGRDHGGRSEGRRNFVEHTEYQNEEDGSKRTRVRYNMEGRFGTAFVFAEVSNQMPAGEFVYILVQDKSNGRVQTIVDNRAALTAQRLAAGSEEAQSAMAQLLAGGGKK